MNFFKFWARSEAHSPNSNYPVTAFGYSNESIDDALRVARERAAETVATQTFRVDLPKHLYYADRPIREEVIEELQQDGQLVAVLTRNSYGCLVLNAANVFIADVDFPESKPSLFSSWFGKKPPGPEQELLSKINNLTESMLGLGLRLYRTFNGFRVIATSSEYRSNEDASKRLLSELGSDPMYVRLCESQSCYRARLSPKPWRIGMNQPSQRYPFRDTDQEDEYRQWVAEYESNAGGYATCALVGDFGAKTWPDSVSTIVQLHDHYALSGDKPIA